MLHDVSFSVEDGVLAYKIDNLYGRGIRLSGDVPNEGEWTILLDSLKRTMLEHD